jgi:hypothetical protein
VHEHILAPATGRNNAETHGPDRRNESSAR